MKKRAKFTKSRITVNNSTVGERLEDKISRKLNNKESAVEETVPMIYGERRDGVQPGTNVRTDRFDVAIDTMDAVAQSVANKREARLKIVGDESTPGTTEAEAK